MNELSNFEWVLIVVSLLVAAWAVWPDKDINHVFKNGFSYAEGIFEENNFRTSIEELKGYVEESRTMSTYNKFDSGIEQAIRERISWQCDILNEDKGGDWYFCNESLKFKDSLNSREIVL